MLPSKECPASLHFLVPFLQRAVEMSEAQPVLAYYCKYYAVSLALKGGPAKFQRTPETDAFLAKLFDDLETEKSNLSHHSTIKDLTQGAIYVRELAYRIFLSAEKQESSPDTLKKSLQSYLAALNFLQVYRGIFLEDAAALDLGEEERLEELGQVDEKSKYAKWRVIEIKKQLMLNSTTASPKSQTQTQSSPSVPVNLVQQTTPISPVQSQTSQPISPTLPHNHLPGHHHSPQQIHPQTSPSPYSPPAAASFTLMYDPKTLSECERYARHAISALNFDDIETAADNLRTALKVLQPFLRENQQQK